MLHVLAGTYFVLLLLGALAVIVGMLFANRDYIFAALGLDDVLASPPLPTPVERRRNPPRVIRMGSPSLALRLAA